ncbi:hypothetical protein JCGZ_07019 [Jatropha curcas]|uniref:RING-type E3 ubiquitin transferase n=1 Tax=Jatropha curcas TaxID=180498 RepID=A0A067KEL6_JATCU|nr:probable E3 ubiquitin-protein ligase RHG1A [Jatropha curcas]XP_037492366.1 probable E3 ubiquitin-protein ligase RHG1A [Jatropha curcas]KDP33448.1 hypothetical protein JCGZ_07019 [Jatropha curcas]
MDDYSGKKAGNGLVVSRKGTTLVLRDTANNRERNAQFCNRIGCSGRLNSAKGTQISCSEKAKSSRPPFRPSSNGKEIIGSSSRTCSATSNPKKFLPGPRKKLSSQPEKAPSETGSSQDDPEVPELVTATGKIQKGICPESNDAGCSENTTTEVGSSSIKSTRSRSSHQKYGIGKLDSPLGSPISLASKSTSQGTRPGAARYGLRNLRCNSISDAVPTGSSTSDSNIPRRKDALKKRSCDGESSSSVRGKKINGSSLEGRDFNSSSGISIPGTRRTRNGPPNRDNGPASVRTRRSLTYTRARAANQGSWNNSSPDQPHVVIRQMSQPIMPVDSNSPGSSHQFSTESSLSHLRSYGLPGSSSESFQGIRPSSPAEVGNIRSSMNRESFRHYNMDGIAEVLLALERIEQDEELTYEQLLVLETGLFLNGLNIYDQHRDMRLDIDNMSYEELLALEERMGTVSTALTEEALSECLKTSSYQSASLEDAASDLCGKKDDVKCSICQEDYTVGDEVGRLQCEHRYHVACIRQWLRQKNWCPICKASAAPSSSPPSPLSSLHE